MTKPKTLKQRSDALYATLRDVIDEDDQSQVLLLKRLTHQLAICEASQEQLEKEGLTIEGKFGSKPHPAINIGYNANALAIRFLNALNIDRSLVEDELDLA